jgi:hypothetical protein
MAREMAKSASGMDFGLVLGISLYRLGSSIGVEVGIPIARLQKGIYERMNLSTERGNAMS